jgi:hypothetical protein
MLLFFFYERMPSKVLLVGEYHGVEEPGGFGRAQDYSASQFAHVSVRLESLST